MAIDVNEDAKEISKTISNYQQYKEFKQSYDNLKKVGGTSFEEDKKKIEVDRVRLSGLQKKLDAQKIFFEKEIKQWN